MYKRYDLVQSKKRYIMTSRKIIDTSTIFQRGKTQVPVEVRKFLGIEDGEKIVWILDSGKIVIDSATRIL